MALTTGSALADIGLRPSDRIALLMQNSSPYIEIYQAAALLGMAVVPLNFRFVASEIEYVVNHSGARALVFDASFVDTIQLLRTKLPAIADRYIITDGPATSAAHSYEALIISGSETPPPIPADLSACYFQGYTSGTTGFPKGCANPHREFADCLRRIATIYGITEDDRELVAAPLLGAGTICTIADIPRRHRVVAAVTLKPGSSIGEDELIAHCKTFLSSFKVPKRIDFRDRLPMSSFGKILRREVRKSYWQQQEVKV